LEQCQLISDQLGHLPLALAQAGSFLATTNTSPDAFLDLYRKQAELILRHKPPKALWQYNETVFTTWELSFSVISDRHPEVAKFLLLLGYMQPDSIWQDLFSLGLCTDGHRQRVWEIFWKPLTKSRGNFSLFSRSKRKGKSSRSSKQILQPIAWLLKLMTEPLGIKGAVAILTSYSLVFESLISGCISMHPLVKEWCRNRELLDRWRLSTDFIVLFGRVLDVPHGRLDDAKFSSIVEHTRTHIPHILEAIRQLDENCPGAFGADLCHAFEGIGDLLSTRSLTRIQDDRLYIEQLAYDKTLKALGAENQLVWVIMGRLSLAFEESKIFDKAIHLATLRAESCTKKLGRMHNDTLVALDYLGKTLSTAGEHEDSRKVLEDVLNRHRQTSERSGASTRINLGFLLTDLDDFDYARELMGEAIAILTAESDWHLLMAAYGGMAWVATGQNQFEESMEYIQKALEIAEEHWGPDSEPAVEWRGQLALHANDIMPLTDEEAVMRIENSFISWMAKYSGKDSKTVNAFRMRLNQAMHYYACGQSLKAKETLESIIHTLEGTSPQQRSSMADAYERLGLVLWDCGMLDDSMRALDNSLAYTDDEDPLIVVRRLNRAVALRDLGYSDEAEKIFRHHLEYANTDGDTALEYTNLASILQLKGQYNEAMHMLQRTINAMRNKIGSIPDLLLTLHRQGDLYAELGNTEEAIGAMREAFDGKVKHLGICRAATLRSGISLQRLLAQNGRGEEAEAIAAQIRPFLQYS
jgi:tetratricopeptide (TPR) repeat protein